MCRLELAFFTLPPEYRTGLFSQIHDIVFHGKGGYDWNTVYNMPIWLRRYTHNTISEFYKKEREEYEKASGKAKTVTENTRISRPAIPNPATYTSTVSKKK